MRRCLVILNEKSGTAAKGAEPSAVRDAFARVGVEAEVSALQPGAIEEALQAAVAARPEAVIDGGGDGTIRCAAAVLAESGVALGVLPLGTLNHFAKDLGVPAALDEAIAALAAGAYGEVDVGEVNGHVFINNCSLGSYPEAVRRREALRREKGHGKWWAMCRAVLRTFVRLRRLRLHIAVDCQPARAVYAPFVFVANNRYSGHLFSPNRRPALDAGLLWVYAAHAHRHLTIVRMFFQALFRRIDAADALEAQSGKEVVIEHRGGPLAAALDGELVQLESPLRFRMRPRVLRVLLPRAAEAEAGAKAGSIIAAKVESSP
jgi:diacylglycerol kinase family enzyme